MIRLEFKLFGQDWEPATWERRKNDFEKDFYALLNYWTNVLKQEAKRLAPDDTGRLRSSIYARVMRNGVTGEYAIELGSDLDVAWWQEYGTGIYSEAADSSHQPITAKYAKRLKIPIGNFRSIASAPAGTAFQIRPGKVRAGTAYIFRFSVKGSKPQHFIQRTIDRYESEMMRSFEELSERHGFL